MIDINRDKDKKYDQLLELMFPNEYTTLELLREIFDRDICNNPELSFRRKHILLTRNERNLPDNLRVFYHLTTEEVQDNVNEDDTQNNYLLDVCQLFDHLTKSGSKIYLDDDDTYVKGRCYDAQRSKRLHWIKTHVDEQTNESKVVVFSSIYRDRAHRKNVFRTYIYNKKQNYVVILEPYKDRFYLLITAFYITPKVGKNGKPEKSSIDRYYENREEVVY